MPRRRDGKKRLKQHKCYIVLPFVETPSRFGRADRFR